MTPIRQRMTEKLRARDGMGLGLELLLVVVGILVAFQLDRAYQASQDRELEQRYLVRLEEDLLRDSAEIAENTRRTIERLGQIDLLRAVIGDPAVAAEDPRAFAEALEKVTWRSVPAITSGTFDELRSTGRSVLLRSEELRRDLATYYGRIEEQKRLGLGEDDQDRFRLETLDLLSGDQLSSIEDDDVPFEMSPSEATRIAEAFRSRSEAHRWLGRLSKYQVLMRRLSREYQARNGLLLARIDSLIERPR